MPTRAGDFPILDTAALRITARLERAIRRLGLDAPGEFVAIINAIDMQLESGRPSVAAVVHLAEALSELVQARAIEPSRIRLAESVDELLRHLRSTTAQTR